MTAEAAVSFLLENVKRLVGNHVHLITGAETELNLLKDDLDLLRALLLRAGKMFGKEDRFRRTEKQVREDVHDAEDAIDSCLTDQAALAQSRSFSRRTHGECRLSLAEEVKQVTETKVKPNIELLKQLIDDGSGANEEQPVARPKKAPRYIVITNQPLQWGRILSVMTGQNISLLSTTSLEKQLRKVKSNLNIAKVKGN